MFNARRVGTIVALVVGTAITWTWMARSSLLLLSNNILAGQYYRKYIRLNRLEDLDKAIDYASRGAALVKKYGFSRINQLFNLGFFHLSRFQRVEAALDLEKTIEYMTQVLLLAPEGHTSLPTLLTLLGSSHGSRFELLSTLGDLDKAIDYTSQAVSLEPQGDQGIALSLNNLGTLLAKRFQCRGELADLENAIKYQSQAILITSQGDSTLLRLLNNIGYSPEVRFQRLGEITDLDKAIEYKSQAISLVPQSDSNIPILLSNLGASLEIRFEHLGELMDLDKGIECMSHALLLDPQDQAFKATLLNNIGALLEERFKRVGLLADLDKAIEHKVMALSLIPQSHSNTATLLNNLGSSLESRFQRLGMLADLDEAIVCQSKAVSLTPQGHSSMPTLLNSLGHSLEVRFERLKNLADIDKAIEHMLKAVALSPEGHPEMPTRLNNLSYSLNSRFKSLGNMADLDSSIKSMRQAVSLTPLGHPLMPIWLYNVGYSLKMMFKHSGEHAHLDESIEFYTQAISQMPRTHSTLPTVLSGLGVAFQIRFNLLGELADLDKAIDYLTQAVSFTPQDHADMPGWLVNLGNGYESRVNLLGLPKDIKLSLDCFQKATRSFAASPFDRFGAARAWGRMSVKHCPSSSIESYQQAILLLPELVWLGETLDARYIRILNMGDVTIEAAAAAIKMKEYHLALEWLEEGKSIVWKQMLQLRTPTEGLASDHPELASTIQQVAHDLDQASSHKYINHAYLMDAYSLEQAAQSHRRLAESWRNLVDQVRCLPGYENFLLPLKAPELMRSAQSGPVVVINLDKGSCDALVIQPGLTEILHVPLPFTFEHLVHISGQLERLLHSGQFTERRPVFSTDGPIEGFEDTLVVLWTEVVRPVLASLGYLDMTSSGDLPHVTWCATNRLRLLPLHAAGDYGSGSRVFDYVVSSYTPTLAAIIPPPLATANFSGILAVGQSSNPGTSSLPSTVVELNQIQEAFRGLTVTRLDEDQATPTTVLAGMQNHSWVHFACHGLQNTSHPMQSAFYLHGGTLDLATITREQLKHADLAFLSACETATGELGLPEESAHLAAGMLMAGYRTVIATMWSIRDADAPLVAEEVYGHLLEGGVPNARRAAVAVHKATARLRATVGVKEFAKWVPYIHIGS